AYARQKANMKLRWPVANLVFASDDSEVLSALRRFEPMILEQANTKAIELKTGEWESLTLAALPNKAYIGKTFKADGPRVMQALAALTNPEVRSLRESLSKGESATLASVALPPVAVTFETRLPEHTSGADFPGGSVYVDTNVTPALQAEGAARDLTRRIQEMRKTMGLAMTATVHIQVAAPAEFQALVTPQLASVRESTRSITLSFSDEPQGVLVKEWDLEGTTITIALSDKEPPAAGQPKTTSAKPATKPGPKKKASEKKATKTAKKPVKPAPKKTKPAPKKPAPTKKTAPKKKFPTKKANGKKAKGKR
ncbi:MAG: DUF5915 domain-containing protein, partial [Candidatus Thermoplasmatota archaeon]